MRHAVALGSALALFALLAAAAPVPKETNEQQLVRLFGTPFDSNKDCEFAFDGKKLTLKVGKGDHALHTSGARNAAPRTLREVEGDFTAEVTATPGGRPQGAMPAMEGRMLKFYSQGLLLWVDDGTFIRFEHAHLDRLNGVVSTYANWELFKDGEWARAGREVDGSLDDSKPTRFRLSRKRNEVRGAWSQDGGKTWKELESLTLDLKAKVRVGVIVNHNTDSPFSATFEAFSITPDADAKK
jgi:regulation of enolase protein 1 (concanavalin A-like superfamily)